MVGRQIASGVTVGGVLSVLLLFLTTPRVVVVDAFADWVPARPAEPAMVPGDEAMEASPERRSLELAEPVGRLAVPERTMLRGGLGLAVASRGGAPLGAQGEASLSGDTEEAALADGLDVAQMADEFSVSPDELSPDAYLGALAKQTVVRKLPEHDSPILGYVRSGTLLRRALVPTTSKDCQGGWYRVEPRGYVCAGRAATLDVDHPVLQLASYAPDRSLPMPYPYGRSRYPTPTLYSRLPTHEEQLDAERDLPTHLAKNFGALWKADADAPPPSQLAQGQALPLLYGQAERQHDFFLGRALGDSTFFFMDMFESEGRYFGLTTDLSLVPLDRVTPVETSEFAGVILGESATLPVAFVMRSGEQLYALEPEGTRLRSLRPIARREGFSLSGRERKVGGSVFLETSGGDFLRSQPSLRKVTGPGKLPKWAKGERTWIDVSLSQQTLVAYRGSQATYATLISSGKDGLGDPETTHSTVQGLYLIHTKHVTATMSGQEADDEFDLRDVPYVQYFHEGYAFHAAYWHDAFGSPKSHGCINLSPADARYLFAWSEPPVPQRWHSALSREGTLVHIHP